MSTFKTFKQPSEALGNDFHTIDILTPLNIGNSFTNYHFINELMKLEDDALMSYLNSCVSIEDDIQFNLIGKYSPIELTFCASDLFDLI